MPEVRTLQMDNKSKILTALPIALIILLGAIAYYIPHEGGFSEAEMRILDFTPSDMVIKKMKMLTTVRALKAPFNFDPAGNTDMPGEHNISSQADYSGMTLSFVVVSKNSKRAIINGNIFKEGDRIDDKKIVRIDPDKVLLKSKKLEWVHLEK